MIARGLGRGAGDWARDGGEWLEPVRGFEPLTCGLRNRCSATELHRLGEAMGCRLIVRLIVTHWERLGYKRRARQSGDFLVL